jgi:hypothetical protein
MSKAATALKCTRYSRQRRPRISYRFSSNEEQKTVDLNMTAFDAKQCPIALPVVSAVKLCLS